MTAVSRATFQANDITRINDNVVGDVVPADHRAQNTDLSDSVPFFKEDIGARGGFSGTAYDLGTKSSGTTTPDPWNGNLQKMVNGGAHVVAPPGKDCSIVIQVTNNASAGAVTFTGWTKATTTGITTVNGADFFYHILQIGSFSRIAVEAL